VLIFRKGLKTALISRPRYLGGAKMKRKGLIVVVVVSLSLFLLTAVHAAAPDLGFYKGKVLNYIVATKPGGGYDAYARLIGKYMQKYLPVQRS